nr:stage II sporulation protein P [uncultured Bacillus sp.]
MKSLKTNRVMISVKGTSIVKAFIGFVLFLLLIFSVSGLLTSLQPQYRPSSDSVNSAASNMTGEMLYHLMAWENHYFLHGLPKEAATPKLSSYFFQLTTNINLDDPRSLLGRELPAFSLFDTEILVAGEGTNYTNMPIESAPPMEILQAEQEAALQNTEGLESQPGSGQSETPPNTTGDKKVVYVYFTHNRESFLPYLEGVTNPDLAFHSQLNVTRIGDKLKEELEKRGIGTVVDKTDIQANLLKKGWSYVQSYQESRTVVEAAVTNNRELTYLIDIHRDSRRKKDTTKVINGVSYAKLAFIVGGEHANYEKNLAFANQLHELLQERYNGLSRGAFTKAGAGTNGKFNQDISENAILIEFGGVDNTFEELNRSAEALADVLGEYYWQAEKVNQPTTEPAQEN